MKTFKAIVKKGVLELFNQKILINFIFFGIVFLDALGTVFSTYLNRKITMFIAFPLILCIYLLNAQKKNLMYIISLIFSYLGVVTFNNPYEEYHSFGVVCHAIGFFIYSIILFKYFQIANISKILKLAIPLVLFTWIPVMIYLEGINSMLIFKEIILYVFSVTVFVFCAFILYTSEKNKINYILMLSGISILFCSYFQGYNLFMEKNDILNFFAVIFFNLTHYLMCLYLIKRSDKSFSFSQEEM